MAFRLVLALAIFLVPVLATAADPVLSPFATDPVRAHDRKTIEGRAVARDGRTLWFPVQGRAVRLVSIDTCELPQWAFDPRKPTNGAVYTLAPVPCGAMAKAWLKRTIGSKSVSCDITASARDGTFSGTCRAGSRDLAIELLRVGLARLAALDAGRADYAGAQRYAMSARYGIWGTYVLDMDEWRTKAVDRTLHRLPVADIDLLKERDAEITPRFHEKKRRPAKADR